MAGLIVRYGVGLLCNRGWLRRCRGAVRAGRGVRNRRDRRSCRLGRSSAGSLVPRPGPPVFWPTVGTAARTRRRPSATASASITPDSWPSSAVMASRRRASDATSERASASTWRAAARSSSASARALAISSVASARVVRRNWCSSRWDAPTCSATCSRTARAPDLGLGQPAFGALGAGRPDPGPRPAAARPPTGPEPAAGSAVSRASAAAARSRSICWWWPATRPPARRVPRRCRRLAPELASTARNRSRTW